MRNPENLKGKDLSSSYFPAAAYNGGNIEVSTFPIVRFSIETPSESNNDPETIYSHIQSQIHVDLKVVK